MDGIHDLGAMEGFGPVDLDDDAVFASDWERRVFRLAVNAFAMAVSNGGQFRHSIERMDPAHYLTTRHYEHWLTGIATRYVETGAVPHDELERRAGGAFPLSGPVVFAGADHPLPRVAPRAVGERVRVRDVATRGHTRCPRYVRGRIGTIVRVDGSASLPDVEAHSSERRVEHQYAVAFDGGTNVTLHVDLFESYLEDA